MSTCYTPKVGLSLHILGNKFVNVSNSSGSSYVNKPWSTLWLLSTLKIHRLHYGAAPCTSRNMENNDSTATDKVHVKMCEQRCMLLCGLVECAYQRRAWGPWPPTPVGTGQSPCRTRWTCAPWQAHRHHNLASLPTPITAVNNNRGVSPLPPHPTFFLSLSHFHEPVLLMFS